MPPKPSGSAAPRGRGASSAAGRPAKGTSATSSKTKQSKAAASSSSRARDNKQQQSSGSPQFGNSDDIDTDPFADDEPSQRERGRQTSRGDMDVDVEEEEEGEEDDDANEQEEEEEPPKTIPPELLTRLLHEFFEKDGTRVSRDANKAVAKYVDIFVREAIARTAVEKASGFLEVEDLEKVAPQLLLDL